MKGKNQTFEVEFRDRKGKNRDFQRQISMNFFKNLPVATKDPSLLNIYCAYNA